MLRAVVYPEPGHIQNEKHSEPRYIENSGILKPKAYSDMYDVKHLR